MGTWFGGPTTGMMGAAAGGGTGCGQGAVVAVTGRASGLNGRSESANGRFVDRLGGPLSSGSLMSTSFHSGITVSMFSSGRNPPSRSRVL